MWSVCITIRWTSEPIDVYRDQYHRAVSPLLRVSHPSQVVLPFPRWEPKEKPVKEDDVGPQVTHIYEVSARLKAKTQNVCSERTKKSGLFCFCCCSSLGL